MRMAEGEKAAAQASVFETQAALRYQLVTNFNELLLLQQRVQFASLPFASGDFRVEIAALAEAIPVDAPGAEHQSGEGDKEQQ